VSYRSCGQAQPKHQQKSRRVALKDIPQFVWTINEKDVDFNDLKHYQIVNHFEGISSLTTKVGLCECLRESSWVLDSDMGLNIAPRCFALGDPVQREDFVEEFKLNAAVNVLKLFIQNVDLIGTGVSGHTMDVCLNAVSLYLRYKYRGIVDYVETCTRTSGMTSMTVASVPSLYNGSSVNSTGPPGGNTTNTVGTEPFCSLQEAEWDRIFAANIELAAIYVQKQSTCSYSLSTWMSRFDAKQLSRCDARTVKCVSVLKSLLDINPQLNCSGVHNVWIVKAPEACRGKMGELTMMADWPG
jgi:hypothetical protein